MTKREFLKAILKGKISADQLKGQPERHFILMGGGEYDVRAHAIVDKGSRYKCEEDGNVYTYEQIEAMQTQFPGLISAIGTIEEDKMVKIELVKITTEEIINQTTI